MTLPTDGIRTATLIGMWEEGNGGRKLNEISYSNATPQGRGATGDRRHAKPFFSTAYFDKQVRRLGADIRSVVGLDAARPSFDNSR